MNFLILGSEWDFYEAAYKDVKSLTNTQYIGKPFKNSLFNKLFKIYIHPKINSVVSLPFKNLWNNIIIKTKFKKNKFKDSDNLCFVIFYDWFILNIFTIEYIRKHYSHAKIVVVFNDLIKMKSMRYSRKPLDIDYLKSITDFILTFDFKEAEEYGLTYHPIPYSPPKLNNVKINPEYDVYFLGQAKNRLDEILSTYHRLIECGAKVNFILANVPDNQQVHLPGITYVNGFAVSYEENLRHIKNSRCLLEIMQKNGSGYTSRTLEAIAYDKKLITNNKYILDAPFYNSEYISVFDNPTNIDLSFIKNLKSDEKVDYNYKENLSPIKLLEFIENQFKLKK